MFADGDLTYAVTVEESRDAYIAKFPSIPSCKARGKTYQEALLRAEALLVKYLDDQLFKGEAVIQERITTPSTLSITVKRPIVSSIEASHKFKLTNDYITRLCRRQVIRSFPVGRMWFLNEESLRLYLEKIHREQKEKHRLLSARLKRELQESAR